MNLFSKTCIIAAAALTFSASTAQARTIADNFTSFFSFGDSLSDQGNVSAQTGGAVPGPDYFEGRFSNGPIWVDPVSDAFDAQGKLNQSFAFGGAKAATDDDPSPDFPLQAGSFEFIGLPAFQGDNALASVFFGGNDLNALGGSLDPDADARNIAIGLGATIDGLIDLGINNIALWNAPNITLTPRVLFEQPQNIETLNDAVFAYNDQIKIEAERLRGRGAEVFEIDVAGLFEDIFADPDSFAITNLEIPCLLGQGFACSNPDEFLFWDGFHPTAKVHALASELFVSTVNPIPLPASSLLLLAAIGALGVARRMPRA